MVSNNPLPDVGYADEISAIDRASANAPPPPMTQLQTMEAAPPAYRGYAKVAMIVAYKPEILNAKPKHDHMENSRLKTLISPC